MSSPPEAGQGPGAERPAYRNEGIRTLLEMFASGDPAEHMPLGQILSNLHAAAEAAGLPDPRLLAVSKTQPAEAVAALAAYPSTHPLICRPRAW